MKKTMRFLSLVLVIGICLSLSGMAVESRASYYISRTAGYVVAGDDGLIIGFTLVGTGRMTDIGATKIEVKNASGTTVATYRYTDVGYSNMMGHNTASYTSSITYEDAISGNDYYAVIYFKAGNSSGSDTDTLTTGLATA